MRRWSPVFALAPVLLLGGVALAKGVPKKRPPDNERGAAIYLRSCFQCHGVDNDGQGPAAASLPGGVPDLRGKVTLESRPGQIEAVMYGVGDMPGFNAEFNERQAGMVLLYMERLDEGKEVPGSHPPKPSMTTSP